MAGAGSLREADATVRKKAGLGGGVRHGLAGSGLASGANTGHGSPSSSAMRNLSGAYFEKDQTNASSQLRLTTSTRRLTAFRRRQGSIGDAIPTAYTDC